MGKTPMLVTQARLQMYREYRCHHSRFAWAYAAEDAADALRLTLALQLQHYL
jgi:hypothetical protein